jgi:dTDP-4-dehydrorhamnose reductase
MSNASLNTNDRVLLLGAGGMLGAAVYEAAASRYANVLATDIDVNEPWLVHQDFRDLASLEGIFEEFRPSIVFHLGALTDLEYCEQNPENSWATNALGPENTALLCQKRGLTMVYISTAGIFGGEQEFYTDFDTPAPTSHYAKSKYYGEILVGNRVPKHFIFRAGWMMGGGLKKDKKFINKIYKQIKGGARELFVVADKLGTPTYTVDFANGMFQVLETGYHGLYNQVCGGSGSRLDVAKEFVKLLGLQGEVAVTQVDSDHWKQEYFAPRPASEKLVNMKLDRRGINFMRDWKVCLAEYAQIFREDLEKAEN